MQNQDLMNIIEAVLFVAGEPVHLNDLSRNLELMELEVIQAVDALENRYNESKCGICLKRFGDHIQLATRAEYAPFVEKMLQPVQKQSLSHAALETLSVIAYRQPVTKLDVEAVRGVKCDYSIQSLINKQLIVEVGRRDTIGRPILYGTTDQFLSHFGLSTLDDLPKPPEKPAPDENSPETQALEDMQGLEERLRAEEMDELEGMDDQPFC